MSFRLHIERSHAFFIDLTVNSKITNVTLQSDFILLFKLFYFINVPQNFILVGENTKTDKYELLYVWVSKKLPQFYNKV